MTLVSLRPTSTIADSGVVTGAASAHAALADDSDSSYVSYNAGGFSTLGLADLTLPAGAILRSAAVRVRVKRVGDAWSLGTVLNGIAGSERGMWVTWINPITVEMAPRITTDLTDALLDATSLFITSTLHSLAVYEAYLDVRYVEIPDLEITAPTGTITNTNRPVVDWTADLDSEGGGATSYEIDVYTEADALGGFVDGPTWTSGVVTGRTRIAIEGVEGSGVQIPVVLADGDYRAYVRIAQIVNGAMHWSAWEYEPFTIDIDLPAEPTLLLTADNAGGRVVIELADNTGAATTDAFQVERSDDGGATWVGVRTVDSDGGVILGTDVTVYDYEAPNGTLVTYQARALHDYVGGAAASDWVSASVTWTSATWWIKHPIAPALNVPIELFSHADVGRPARRAVLQPVGAIVPVVISDTRGSAQGTVVVQSRTTAAQDALDAVLDTTAIVLLQGPVDHGEPDRYVSFGDAIAVRVVDNGAFHTKRTTLPWVQVAFPAGAQTGEQYTPAGDDDGEDLVIA